jgi:hypothetical protein
MDPFDEFEFKPLTEGLGFHKKSVTLKEGLKKSGVLDGELNQVPASVPRNLMQETAKIPEAKKHSFEDVLSALEKTPLKRPNLNLEFTEPLPREKSKDKMKAMDIAIDMPMPITPPVQSPFPQPDAYKKPVLKKIPTQTEQVSVGTRRGAADSPQRILQPATVSFASAGLDLIVVMALAIVFLIALLLVTKVDLAVVLTNLDRDPKTQVSLLILFITVMQMYAIVARSFFGRTLGEWTFDVQLGQDKEQSLETYPLKVAARSVLTTFTGLIFLPLISAMVGHDVAGRLTGVQLYRQRI